MKEKVLFLVSTYYQIISSINIVLTLKKNSDCYMIITDTCKNSDKYADNAKKLKCLKSVWYLKTKDFLKLNFLNRYFLALKYNFLKNSPFFEEIRNIFFDEIVTYNVNYFTSFLLRQLIKTNKNIKCSRIEEGLISYDYVNYGFLFRNKIINCFLNMFKFNDYIKRQSLFYCTFPNFYKGKMQTVQVPLLDKNNKLLIESLSTIFGLNVNSISYPQKYIFFPSILDISGGKPVGELILAKELAKLVGKENLLVKVHPRDNIERFTKEGLIVDKNSSLPWEALQLFYDFSNHVFITVLSGCVISVNSILNKPTKTFFLYPIAKFENNILAKITLKNFKTIFDDAFLKNKLSFVKIVNSLDEFPLIKQ